MKLILMLFLCVSSACASAPYKELVTSIYCPTCQGQVLDESNSPVAITMKAEITQMLADGLSVEAIKQHYSQLYGEHVLLRPSLEPYNYLLWLAPFLALGVILMIVLRRMHFFRH